MSLFKLSAFADEYSENFSEQLKALNIFGIENLEIRGVDGKNISTLSNCEVEEVRTKLDYHNIKVSSIGSPLGKINIEDDIAAHIETAKRVFEIANKLDCDKVRVFSFYLPAGKSRAECESKVFDALSCMLFVAKQSGVTLCHENEALIYGESPEDCLRLLKYFSGEIKAVFDMGNFVLDGYDPIKAYKMLYDYIEYFHIKDALAAGAVVPPGTGEAKISEILKSYKDTAKRDTYITLEPHLQTFGGLNALVGKTFDNPYKYENLQTAFTDAYNRLRELI